MPSFAYSPERVSTRLRPCHLENAVRIIWARHLTSPLGCAPKASRFSDGTFAILYAAAVFETAVLETVIRDQFARTSRRELGLGEIAKRAWVHISTRSEPALNLLDLRGSGCVELGAPTDAVHARNTTAGQALGRSIYRHHPEIDGLIYSSRFAGTDNFAIFDRALGKLAVADTGFLLGHVKAAEVEQILNRHDIRLLESRVP